MNGNNGTDTSFDNFNCIDDFKDEALRKMSVPTKNYITSGADAEITLRRNLTAFNCYVIRPFYMRDVSNIDTSVSFTLGDDKYVLPLPFAIAPTAFHRILSTDGETDTMMAANKFKIPFILSTLATVSATELGCQAPPDATLWFQMYVFKDREITKRLIVNAVNAGFKALVLTVDTPQAGKRRKVGKDVFSLPDDLDLANMRGMFDKDTKESMAIFKNTKYSAYFDDSLTWEIITWIRQVSNLPVIVKGVLREEDALSAIKCGASAIYVSNHGGRQLDTVPATIQVLPEIVSAVNKIVPKVPVFVDCGFRTGSDAFKAIALGADVVFLGRPILYGLSVGGQRGVERVLDLFKTEFERTMKCSGMVSIAEMKKTKNLVVKEHDVCKI
uniref:FMN hydroxy acid dehydrogenase domain-containing protein n=1 Tax=Rhabditophanes sp. KR3021 TaxID=114890 RepID=A0AC35UHV0_9BILA